jgi:phosphomethylpyrimidine synthase
MEITQQIREYADEHGYDAGEAIAQGMGQKSEEFRQRGGEIYHEV